MAKQKQAIDENTRNQMVEFAEAFQAYKKHYTPDQMKAMLDAVYDIQDVKETSRWEKKCDSWASSGQIDQSTADFLKQVPGQEPLVAGILKALIPISLFFKWMSAANDIASLEFQYKNLAKSTPNPAPVEFLVRSMMIDPTRATENRKEMKKFGYDDTQIDNIILSAYKLYDESTIRTAFLRGIISQELMYERMRELGYTDTRTKEIIQTWTLLPPPADLFTMVAHEAFEPDIYEELGLNQEFPTEQVEWLKQQGISEDWARKYWIAHWNQPSLEMGFEMFHRGVIDWSTLDVLFKTVEIPPYWREKLTQIAYNPLARVDVRRMHETGDLNDDELVKAYLANGYSPENALKMANFTIKYNAQNDRDLTKSTILTSYREGLISRADALQLLKDSDYSEKIADYYLALEEFNREKEIQDIQIDNLKEQYLLGLISETQTRDTLNKAGLLGDKVNALMDQWSIQLYKYQRLPSKSDLDRFLMMGLIQENEYIETMQQLGFAFRHIQLYLEDLKGDINFEGRAPTKADLDRWAKNGILTKEQYNAELRNMGYAQKYAAIYTSEHYKK
jgi:hypothetical protein